MSATLADWFYIMTQLFHKWRAINFCFLVNGMKINGREMSQNTLEYVINFYKRIHPTATLQNVSRFPFFAWFPQLNYMIGVNKQVERGRERKSPVVWPFQGSYLTPQSRPTRLAGTVKSHKYLFVYGRICLHNNNKFFDIVLVVYFFQKMSESDFSYCQNWPHCLCGNLWLFLSTQMSTVLRICCLIIYQVRISRKEFLHF